MMTTDALDKMVIAIMSGATEPHDLNAEEHETWRALVADIARIRSIGGIVDIPGEVPDVG